MTRRELLLKTGQGFGAVALAGLLEAAESNPLAPKPPHAPAKAKSIILATDDDLAAQEVTNRNWLIP